MSDSARDAGVRVQAPSTSSRGGWLRVLWRWPAALAFGPWVVTMGGGDAESMVWMYGHIFLMMPLLYLFASAVSSCCSPAAPRMRTLAEGVRGGSTVVR